MNDINQSNLPFHLLIIALKDPEKESHVLDTIETRFKETIPEACKIAPNVYIFRDNDKTRAAADACIPLLPSGAGYLNLSVIPPAIGLCDLETKKHLVAMGLDPYCTITG